MNNQDYTTSFVVAESPEAVFNAITNVGGWWSQEVKGGTAKLNDEFDYHYQDIHICKMRLTEVIPNKKIVWLVLDNYFKFATDQGEWKGTTISFEITKEGNLTKLAFTHHGLTPGLECYDICSDAWGSYIGNSLKNLVTTGQGAPNPREATSVADATAAAALPAYTQKLKGQKVVVTGGSRGLGLGMVEALVAQDAMVTIVGRNEQHLNDVKQRLHVQTFCGDVADEQLTKRVIHDVQPTILILNAGATPVMGPLHKQSWEDFGKNWEVDVKAGFYWLQQVILLPLAPGSRVLIVSSGAASNGSPLSGSYAGAKRMLWLMAGYANGIAKSLGLDIHFQVLVPMQIIGDTELGNAAAEAYAQQKGVSKEALLAGFGTPLPPDKVGDYVVSILTDPLYSAGVAYGIKGDLGIVLLDN